MVLGIVLSLAQALCWATTTILLRKLSTRLDPFFVNGLRAGVGLLVVIPLVIISGGLGDYAKVDALRFLYLAGSVAVGGVLGDALYVLSLKKLGVSRAFPITNSYPLFTLFMSAVLLGERITWGVVAGMVLVMGGVYLVGRPRGHVSDGSGEAPLPPREVWKGVGMALLTAMTWGFTSVVLSLGLKDINPFVANSLRIPVVAILSVLAGLQRGNWRQLRDMDWATARLVILAGITGWGIGGSFFVSALQLAGPTRVAIVGATSPLFGVPLSALFLHERPTRTTLAGTLLTVLGVVLVVAV